MAKSRVVAGRSDTIRVALVSAAATSALLIIFSSFFLNNHSEIIRGKTTITAAGLSKFLKLIETVSFPFLLVSGAPGTVQDPCYLACLFAVWNEDALQILLSTRVCGSPAIEGYAHVDAQCLERSPTNAWWKRAKPQADDLLIHIEKNANYDGLAVAWGIGNTMTSLKECAKACKQHIPPGVGESLLPTSEIAHCSTKHRFAPNGAVFSAQMIKNELCHHHMGLLDFIIVAGVPSGAIRQVVHMQAGAALPIHTPPFMHAPDSPLRSLRQPPLQRLYVVYLTVLL